MIENELRIGNWVFSKSFEANYKVKGIKFNGELWLKNKDGSLWESNGMKYIEPIPLTEEWLLKFGFDVSVSHYICKGKFAICSIDDHFMYRGTELAPEIHYVHQLQNLYHALTGQELKIKIDETNR